MEINSYLLRERVNLSALAASGVVGTAAATVDIVSNIGVAASVAALNFTLPNPTDTRSGRSVIVTNTGAQNFTMYANQLKPGQYIELIWGAEDSLWHSPSVPTESAADFWRTDPTGLTPDGLTDPADAIVRTGQTKIDTGTNGDSGLTLDDLRSRASTQLSAGDGGVTDTNMTAIGVDLNGKVRLSNSLSIPDIRATNPNPQDYAAGFSNVFKQSATIGMTGIYNVPTYVNLTTTRQYAQGGDFSGGQVRQDVDFPDGRQYFRLGTSATTWGPWTLEGGCPAPMTRAALIALRAAGALNVGCHYVITDYVQGRFLAGTTITMHADSATELSMNATVNSLYDNSGWECRYDIDTNNMLMCKDNLDNIVESDVTGRVAAWDWGNTALTKNRIQGSVVVTYGNTNVVTGLTVTNYGSVDLTGRTGGSLADTTVDGQLYLINSNLTVLRSRIANNANIQAQNYAAGGAGVVNTVIENTSSLACNSATAGTLSVTNGRITSGSIVSHTGTGTFAMSNTTVADSAQLAHSSTGAFNATGTFIHGGSTAIAHTTGPGAMTLTGCDIGPFGRVSKNDPASTGAMALNQCAVKSGGHIQQLGAGNMTLTRFDLDSEGAISIAAGANFNFTGAYSKFSGGGYFTGAATATAGDVTFNNNVLSSSGFVQKTGTGVLSVGGCNISNTSRILLQGARNLNAIYNNLSALGYLISNATGPAGIADAVQYNNISAGGSISLTAAGAATNTLYYNIVQGSSSAINLSGTTTGWTVVSNTAADNSIVTIANSVAGTMNYNNFSSNAVVQVTAATAAQDVRYNTVSNASSLLLGSKSVASTTYYNSIRSAGQLQLNAAAGNASVCSIEQGSVTSTGGTLNRVKKSLAGTLNTNTQVCDNIVHETTAATTLTANNTGRATRLGVTNTLPLI
jgi:hypothetical protein